MAREAIARLYDVDKNSIVYTKPSEKKKYSHGTIDFRAKPSKLVNLAKIHESVWATRLSRGTGSALVRLDVTVAGSVVVDNGSANMIVPGAKTSFILAPHPKKKSADGMKYDELLAAIENGKEVVSVTGQLEGWKGRWPGFLKQPLPEVNRIFVTGFETKELPSEN